MELNEITGLPALVAVSQLCQTSNENILPGINARRDLLAPREVHGHPGDQKRLRFSWVRFDLLQKITVDAGDGEVDVNPDLGYLGGQRHKIRG